MSQEAESRSKIVNVMKQCEELLKKNNVTAGLFVMEAYEKEDIPPRAMLRIVLPKDSAIKFCDIETFLDHDSSKSEYTKADDEDTKTTMHALMEVARGTYHLSETAIDLFLGFIEPQRREKVKKNLQRFLRSTPGPNGEIKYPEDDKSVEDQLLA